MIKDAKLSERWGGIALPDLESVKEALHAYSDGLTEHSDATRKQLVADGGGMIAAMMPFVQPVSNKFADYLCRELEKAIVTSGSYRRHFDYDGVGPFFKTTIEVQQLKDGGYLLTLSAAYVGNKVEEGLAEYLAARRGLWWTNVDVTFDARQGDRFAVDFNPIAERLDDTAFGPANGWLMAWKIAQGRAEEPNAVPSRPGIITLLGGRLGNKAGADIIDRQLKAVLGFDEFTVGRYDEQPFEARETVVIGPLTRSLENPSVFADPVVNIEITELEQTVEGQRLPALYSDIQDRMREHAADILERFQP